MPSDRNLWPGELPFTAFGQFGEGKLDLRVFDQDVYWVDRAGRPHVLAEMSLEYQANVIMFLREFADSYHAAQALRATAQFVGDTMLGLPPVEGLDPEEIIDTPALEWLESTPLLRRLRHLTGTSPVLP